MTHTSALDDRLDVCADRKSFSSADAGRVLNSIRDFALIGEDFTTENEMLTPSLKLKRRAVLAKWGGLLEELYAKKRERSVDASAKKKAEASAE